MNPGQENSDGQQLRDDFASDASLADYQPLSPDAAAQPWQLLAGKLLGPPLATYLGGSHYLARRGYDDHGSLRMTAQVTPANGESFGLAFRVQDATHLYRFVNAERDNQQRLERVDGATVTVLASNSAPARTGSGPRLFTVEADGVRLRVFQGHAAPILQTEDATYPAGTVAFYSQGSYPRFDDLAITPFDPRGDACDQIGRAHV